jgi:hypothetical protein
MSEVGKYADEYEGEYEDGADGQPPDEELQGALQEVLGEDPRADELRHMKALLVERRARLAREMDTAESPPEREALRRELKKLDEQIEVLGEEAEITRFVEDSVRVGLEMRRLS